DRDARPRVVAPGVRRRGRTRHRPDARVRRPRGHRFRTRWDRDHAPQAAGANMSELATLRTEQEGTRFVARIAGEVDISNAQDLEMRIRRALPTEGAVP